MINLTNKKMKNILLFILSVTSVFAQTNYNTTTNVESLKYYTFDFTDTDGDGMTDVAERKYGFDPNDASSFPNKDYTFLVEDGRPTLPESTGVFDPNNEIRFQFDREHYLTNRQGTSNLDKLASDRELFNLTMPILLHELGLPPSSFIVDIKTLNRGAYANGHMISLMDNTSPSTIIHELSHVWKDGWNYNFMRSPGANRGNLRGYEEGMANSLAYRIGDLFVEAYPNHKFSTEYWGTGIGAKTWHNKVSDFDVLRGVDWLQGGTFFGDHFTGIRYEMSGGVFDVLQNQRPGVMRDLLEVLYKASEENPDWDYTTDVDGILALWETVLPTVNGIKLTDWIKNLKILDGKPAEQRLYIAINNGDDKTAFRIVYPDKRGNFKWSYSESSFADQNIPSWFPTQTISGKVSPKVNNIPYNASIETIFGETAVNVSNSTDSKKPADGATGIIEFSNFPLGLYKTIVEIPQFAQNTEHHKNSAYAIRTTYIPNPSNNLNLHVGLDIPVAERVRIRINNGLYESNLTNGLSVFNFDDIGVNFTGVIDVLVSDGNTEHTFKRTVSHWGTKNNTNGTFRLNQFLIVDTDFDGIEDAFDSSVTPLTADSFTSFAEIKNNSYILARSFETTEVTDVPPPPPPPGPIDELKQRIAELEAEVAKLTTERNELLTRVNELNNLNNELASANSELVAMLEASDTEVLNLRNELESRQKIIDGLLVKVAVIEAELVDTKAEKQSLVVEVEELKLRVSSLETIVQDYKTSEGELNTKLAEKNEEIVSLKSTIIDFNATIVELNATVVELNATVVELNATNSDLETLLAEEKAKNSKTTDENSELSKKVEELLAQVNSLQSENNTLKSDNENLNLIIRDLSSENTTLTNSNTELNQVVAKLNKDLDRAVKVASVPFIDGWFYDADHGWLFTDAEMYPLVFRNKTQSWHYYELGSTNPRYFYSYKDKKWEAWD